MNLSIGNGFGFLPILTVSLIFSLIEWAILARPPYYSKLFLVSGLSFGIPFLGLSFVAARWGEAIAFSGAVLLGAAAVSFGLRAVSYFLLKLPNQNIYLVSLLLTCLPFVLIFSLNLYFREFGRTRSDPKVLMTPLQEAIEDSNGEKFSQLIEGGHLNLDETLGYPRPLFMAIETHQTTFAIRLLEKGADPLGEPTSESPLSFAAYEGEIEVVEKIIQLGTPVDAPCHGNETAIERAARGGQFEMVKRLLVLGAKIQGKENTLLLASAAAGSKELAEFFTAKGANVNSEAEGESVLSLAIQSNQVPLVRFLLQHHASTQPPEGRESYLALALSYGQSEEIMIQLLKAGFPFEGRLANGRSLLEEALLARSLEVLKAFRTVGVNFLVLNEKGQSLLHLLAREPNDHAVESAKFLLSTGIDLQQKDQDHQTALDVAKLSNSDHGELVKFLDQLGRASK